MKALFILLFILLSSPSFAQEKELMEELNAIRSNPQAYFESQDTVLSGYTAKLPLQWDDSLAMESKKHAEELLSNRTLFHSSAYTYSESILESNYKDNIVKAFILEQGRTDGEDGHRNQLLSKNNAHTRIGIGIAEGRDENSDWLPVYYVVIRTY